MLIRPACAADAAAIAAIYAPEVQHGTASFELVPPDATAMAARLAAVQARGWPWLVAEDAGLVIGYAYASQFRDRPAYAGTCENSVYVSTSARGRGVGTALLTALFDASRTAGFGQMIAVVGDASGNAASLALHGKAGFVEAGRLTGVGRKFERWLDVAYLQRAL